MLEKLFGLKENNTSLRRELIAGFTNFMTISYIIFVQPSMLSQAGMDYGAVMVATCLSSALATFGMAFFTNYPVVLAPGMGLNCLFSFLMSAWVQVVPWQEALGHRFHSRLAVPYTLICRNPRSNHERPAIIAPERNLLSASDCLLPSSDYK